MKTKLLLSVLLTFLTSAYSEPNKDPLPSWSEGDNKAAIMNFVNQVTDQSSPNFVPVKHRIATFDNDGTLWSEQPFYFQLFFAFDQIKANAKNNPSWQTEEPFSSVIKGDYKNALKNGVSDIQKIINASHGNIDAESFNQNVSTWLKTAKHPTKDLPYTQMVYQPMLELINYLQQNNFKTFIVSGGGIAFMRTWSDQVYNIPPEQVIGSQMKTEVVTKDGKPVLIHKPEIAEINDKVIKIQNIYQAIGQRPIAAFGNSDGDLSMLEYTMAGDGLRLAVYIHHTDADREWAYDSESHVGQLKEGLQKAKDNNWLLVDMKSDWNIIFPKENKYQ